MESRAIQCERRHSLRQVSHVLLVLAVRNELLTFVKAIHIELPDERGNISVLKVGPVRVSKMTTTQAGSFNRALRKNFRELGRWGHDKAFVRTRPRDQVLDGLILEHTAQGISHVEEQRATTTSIPYL